MSLIAIIPFFFLSFGFIAIGVLFFESNSNVYRYTAMSITEFWNFYQTNGIKTKEVPLMATFSGIFLICIAVFNIMNFCVMLKHLMRGGLKTRLSFFNYIVLILHIALLGYSLIPFLKHGGMLFLNWALLILGGLSVINASFLFYLIIRLTKIESTYLLSITMIKKHKQEFIDEYIKNSRGNYREMEADVNHNAIINRNTMS
jgi:ammonia channel protein AmtB